MSGIGKLLLVVNIVLSVAFMALAMAVFSTHTNWRDRAQDAETEVRTLQGKIADATAEVTAAQEKEKAAVDAAEDRARELQGRLQGVVAERDAFEAKNNRLEQQLQTQTGIASTKASEAVFRKEQASEQSTANLKLRDQINSLSENVRDLQDELFSRKLEAEEVTSRYNDLLEDVAVYKKIFDANNISANLDELAASQEPPPPIDGLITETRKDKTGNVRFVSLSIGSDDGLAKGHTLSVFRPASRNEGRADYLGEVQIVEIYNDVSVALVVDKAKNGIIEVQDNVTSRL